MYNEKEGDIMLHIAIVETEAKAKELVFEIGLLLYDYAWNFSYVTSIMDFFKAEKNTAFDIVFFHEQYHTKRIYESLIKHQTYSVIFICDSIPEQTYANVNYVNRNQIAKQKEYLKDLILPLAKLQEDFCFSYQNVTIMMKIKDIQYIEKQDKYLIFHTNKGEFKQRGNMSDAIHHFENYGFLSIHVSFLVNEQFLLRLDKDEVVLHNFTRLPISRSKSHNAKAYFRKKTMLIP